MSASNAPTYYFTGIQFNSAFYNGNETLTQSQASSLYLLKNTPDTATALETFSGGIKTNSILPVTSSPLSIGLGATTINIPCPTIFTSTVEVQNILYPNYIEVSLVNAPLNIGVTNPNTLNLGTASNAIVIGKNGIATNMYGTVNLARNTSGTKNTYMEAFSATNANTIDFHSSGLYDTDYDSRITAYNGTATAGQGTLELKALNTNITNSANLGYRTQTNPTYTEFTSTASTNRIDFHSSGSNIVSYDSKIVASGGSSSVGQGTIDIEALTLTLTTPTINANGNLIMGTGRNITLQPATGYVAPTADTMLGGITAGTFSTPASAFSATKNIASIVVVKGTYTFYINFEANYTVLPTTNYVNMLSVTALPAPTIILGPSQAMIAGQVAFFGSVVITITTAGTLVLRYNVAGGTINSITTPIFYAVRIA